MSSTPQLPKGSHQTADCESAPRESHPSEFIRAAPIACDIVVTDSAKSLTEKFRKLIRCVVSPLTTKSAILRKPCYLMLGLWLGRSIIIPIACHRRISSKLILLTTISRSAKHRLGVIIKAACASHNNRKVSDE